MFSGIDFMQFLLVILHLEITLFFSCQGIFDDIIVIQYNLVEF